ncbi:hypothetical protein Golax_002314 [Gossypium laxum]|uniref:DUF4283 domain-containing protein n=1 Tax=Gossypium laxum TaxID=34288 RepID=A0A7J9AR98_9ROSI|nr:hypothetical protein [Gossypium laxum]
METTVVVKLLGHNLAYNSPHNRIFSLWKLAHASISWTSKMYLMIQPWTLDFNPLRPFPKIVMAWVWLPGLPSFLYKRRILEEIGGLVDKVAKLDYKIDRGSRGRFARMAVFINLEKLLISQILVNDTVHRVEYEVLSAVCFACDRYGHVQDLCPFVGSMTDGGGSKAETTINIP